jgi:hypothetical protein
MLEAGLWLELYKAFQTLVYSLGWNQKYTPFRLAESVRLQSCYSLEWSISRSCKSLRKTVHL